MESRRVGTKCRHPFSLPRPDFRPATVSECAANKPEASIALGDVIDPKTGQIIAGARSEDGKSFIDTAAKIRGGYGVLEQAQPLMNTTLAVVATNAALDKTQLTKVAQMAHDGLARTISPIHTLYDGDTIFAVSTDKLTAKVNHGAVGAIAADVLATAVIRAVTQATAAAGLPSYRDLVPVTDSHR